ncbi:hypothetical protein BpHYR1_028496 [Brachionus plicatilis]|uniref:Uncharacterized protein n=1 Tax=Brachionus plicatilis TaxID=10195 RepID=A0A3M7T6D8_BRAPC|nr:hypothetical protein BpHYR1_028496 [Brachionus plicatilis]
MGFFKIEAYIDGLYNSSKRNLVFRQIKLDEIKFLIDGMQLTYMIMFCYLNGQYGGNYDTFYEYLIKLFTKLKPSIHLIVFKSDKEKDSKKRLRMERYAQDLNQNPMSFEIDKLKFNPGLFNKSVIIQAIKDLNISYLETNNNEFLAYYANGFNSTKSLYTIFSKDSYYNVYDLQKGYFSWSYGMEFIKKFEQFDDNTSLPIFYLCDFLNFVQLKHESWIYFCILNGDKDEIERNLEFIGSKKFDYLLNSMRMFELKNLRNNFRNIRKFYSFGMLQTIDKFIKNFKFELEYCFEKYEFDVNLRYIESLKMNKQKLMPCLIEDADQSSVFDSANVLLILDEIFSVLFKKGESVKLVFRDKNFNLIEKEFITKNPNSRNISNLLESKDAPDNIRALLVSLCMLEKEHVNLLNAIIINMMIIHLKKDRILDLYSCRDNIGEIGTNLAEKYDQILNRIDETNFNHETIKLVHLINKFQAIYYVTNILNKLVNPSVECITVNLVLNGYFVTMYLKYLNIRNEIDKIISENKFLYKCKNHLFTLLSGVKNHYNCLLFKQLGIDE